MLSVSVVTGDTMSTIATKLQAQISLNSELAGKITASASTATAALRIRSANFGAQYAMRVETSTSNQASTGTAAFTYASGSSRGSSANILNFTAVTEGWSGGRTANVTVAANTYSSFTALETAINNALKTGTRSGGGSGGFSTVSGDTSGVADIAVSMVNTNQLQFTTRDEGSAYSLKMNDVAGVGNDTAGYGALQHILGLTADTIAVSGTDALVSVDNYTSTITAVKYNSTGDTTLWNKAAGEAGRGSVHMTIANAQTGVNVGNLLLDVSAATFAVRLDGGPATTVQAGIDAQVYNAARTESVKVNYDLTSLGGTEQITNTDRSLVFQVGPNVGQTVSISLRNMSASALGQGLAGNSFLNLSEINVTTSQGAQDAQSVIDQAINNVSTSRGALGSFQKNSLESNLRNLRIASQNLTSAESQIRDTDMALEMSEFTKNQILVQAGTAMLAQANQVPQVVLSLF
ncbi:MAG: hypothetical protein DRP45_03455 [Candidatus Zixiibacteriota bacterium]|nr:MAG: hypothetical protein DRP45_03455 [candidate division Zixibacteria bacterium]